MTVEEDQARSEIAYLKRRIQRLEDHVGLEDEPEQNDFEDEEDEEETPESETTEDKPQENPPFLS